MPPNLKADQLASAVQDLVDCVDQILVKFADAIIVVGGDFNGKNIQQFTSAFPIILPVNAGATRRGAALDEIYSNVTDRVHEKLIQSPLCNDQGIDSDHSVIAASFKLPKQAKSVAIKFKFRPITVEGIESFRRKIVPFDWSAIRKSCATQSAEALNKVLQSFVEECFPERTRSIRNTDAPWLDRKSKRLINKKQRIYKAEGKSLRYRYAAAECEAAIKAAKTSFLGKVKEKVKNSKDTKSYYKIVNMFKCKDAPKEWDIVYLFPGTPDEIIVENVASFFNQISQEYDPLPDPRQPDAGIVYIEPYQVSARLRSFKKPKSRVPGDISPDLVNEFHDILAEPLAFIFNQALNTLIWPDLWKMETVHVIPKNSAPSGLAELRNLSCTPLFSKVLESFVLERLKNEAKLSSRQFGGIRGCGTDHFLIETWDTILNALEQENSAVNLLSVDFEKAFNRMDHFMCLNALSELGASKTATNWVAAFLYNRKMSVKIRESKSAPRTVPGGSPQGSILGNFLFCATTDKFASINPVINYPSLNSDSSNDNGAGVANYDPRTPATAVSTPTSRGQFACFQPPQSLLNLSGDYESDEEDFRFFRLRDLHSFDSTDSGDAEVVNVPDTLCPDQVTTMVYIDDYNSIERVKVSEAESHISTSKRKIRILAQRSEKVFDEVQLLANEINMKVNSKKTQMLCIYSNYANELSSYINTNATTIESTTSLKILGFNFGVEPNASFHVTGLIDRFYSKLWTLRFLKRSGMDNHDLLGVFNQVIRPSVEFSSIIYHPLIPKYLANRLESVQRQAMKIIFGWAIDYNNLIETGVIQSLEQRRIENALKFAIKAANSSRFGNKWFHKTPETDITVRPSTRKKYVERFYRTERGKSNPLNFLTKLLNEHESK